MIIQEEQSNTAVGISISNSPDLYSLRLSEGHLYDAMAEIALQVLASGICLAYGGDLRPHGFTELLAELVRRYQDHPRHQRTIVVTDYLAWPVHIRMTPDDITAFSARHERSSRLVFLTLDGTRLAQDERLTLCPYEPTEEEWSTGLTAMRTVMRRSTFARILLGGKVKGFKGVMPGIAEEACLSMQAGQPVYLAGGFGGCTRDIAETLGLVGRWIGSRDRWPGRDCFRRFSSDDLNNGLSKEENVALARTPHIEEAVTLIIQGLRKSTVAESNGPYSVR